MLRVPGCGPASQTAEFLARMEEAGFAGAGIPDSQLIMRDSFVSLALAAQRTSHLKLFPAVTNPVTRHVSVLASLAQTVEELAPGRVGIIVGSGYSAVKTIGRQAARLGQIRQTVDTLRRLLSGETVSLGGFDAHLAYASGRKIPILIAATGPRTIELAGEVADGALLSVGLHPAMMEGAWSDFESGAKMAGRDPRSMEVIYVSRVHVAQDMESAWAMARPVCAQWAIEPYRANWLRVAGLEIPEFELSPELRRLYPDIPHAENWEEARRLTSFLSDRMVADICEAIGLFGTLGHVTRRLEELEGYGVRTMFLQTLESYSYPETTLHVFQEEIFPRLRGSGLFAN